MTSAVETGNTTASPQAGTPASKKPNALPHEARVIVTGTRPAKGPAGSELFTEETTTVLAFPDGAVVRLASPVSTGQLLFLNNIANKREVIAQVTGKRGYQGGSYSVELQFTEPSPGYWGFEFPKAELAADAQDEGADAASARGSAGTGAGPSSTAHEAHASSNANAVSKAEPETSAAAPSASELEQLRREIERLRGEVSSLKTKATCATQSAATVDATQGPAPKMQPADQLEKPANTNIPLDSAQAGTSAPKRAIPRMALPVASATATNRGDAPGQAEFSEENLSPKPALKSDRAPQKQRGIRLGILTLALLTAMAVAGYEFRAALPWARVLGRLRGQTPTVVVPPTSRAAARVSPPDARPQTQPSSRPGVAASAATPSAPSPAVTPSAPAPANVAIPAPSSVTNEGAKPAAPTIVENINSGASTATIPVSPPRHRSGAVRLPERKVNDAVGTDSSEQDKETTPPKLVKSVRAIPPPEAVRRFVTGNIVLDVAVSADGRVTTAKALSGPKILRPAAVDTVKRYTYEPARRDGKAVAAHTQVTVQFWYEP